MVMKLRAIYGDMSHSSVTSHLSTWFCDNDVPPKCDYTFSLSVCLPSTFRVCPSPPASNQTIRIFTKQQNTRKAGMQQMCTPWRDEGTSVRSPDEAATQDSALINPIAVLFQFTVYSKCNKTTTRTKMKCDKTTGMFLLNHMHFVAR